MARPNQAKAAAPRSREPANVKGAKRSHPRLRAVKAPRPVADYEIVHGTVVMPDPDHEPTATQPFKLAHYFPGEVLRLGGEDAEQLLARGIVVPLGDEPVLHHTMPDRGRSYHDEFRLDAHGEKLRNPDPQPEGRAKLVHVDIEDATALMYGADSSSERLGGLNGSGR